MKRKSTGNPENLGTIAITTKRRDTSKPMTRHFPDADVAELHAAAMQMSTTVGALIEDIVTVWVATKRCAQTHERPPSTRQDKALEREVGTFRVPSKELT